MERRQTIARRRASLVRMEHLLYPHLLYSHLWCSHLFYSHLCCSHLCCSQASLVRMEHEEDPAQEASDVDRLLRLHADLPRAGRRGSVQLCEALQMAPLEALQAYKEKVGTAKVQARKINMV